MHQNPMVMLQTLMNSNKKFLSQAHCNNKAQFHIWINARPHSNLLPRGEGERFHVVAQFGALVSIAAFFIFSAAQKTCDEIFVRTEQNSFSSP